MCTNRNHQEKSCCTIDHEVYVVKSVMLNICVHVYTLTSTPLAFPSPLPAIMCSWGVFSGPWLSFPPPLPSHFLITSPLPSLTGAQTRLSLRYSTFRSVPHFLAVLRHDPAVTGNGHLQRSFLSLAQCLSHTLRLSPPHLPSSAHTWNRSQIISSTLSVVRQLLSPLVTSSAPATAHCSTLSGPSSIIPILHTVGVITLLVASSHDSHLYYCWCATVSLSA